MVNRYAQPLPAQDNYFNTFVPLPLNELTALGMSRQQDLERNQSMIDKAYNDVLNIQATAGSADETLLKTKIIPKMTDMAMKYATKDLTQPSEMSNFRRELRTNIDPNTINRIQQSAAGYKRYQAAVADLKMHNQYHPSLDNAPNISTWDSEKNGVFNFIPRAYQGRAALLEPYFHNLRATFKRIDPKTGMSVSGIGPEDVDRVAKQNAEELASTPQGQDEIRIFKDSYPAHAKGLSDVQIMRLVANDYGSDRIGYDYQNIPGYTDNYLTGKLGGDSSSPVVTDYFPAEGMNPNATSKNLYSSDKERATALATQITAYDTQLKKIDQKVDPVNYTRVSALRNQLMDEKQLIDNSVNTIKQQYEPEFAPKRDAILNQYFAKMKAQGYDETAANDLLKGFEDQGDNSPIHSLRLRIIQLQDQNKLKKRAKSGLNTLSTLNKLFGYMQPLSSTGTFENQLDIDDLKKQLDADPNIKETPEKNAIDAYFSIRKLNNQMENKVAKDYSTYAATTARSTTGILMPNDIDISEKGVAQAPKEIKPAIQQISQLLSHLRDTGGQNIANIKDISPVTRSKDLISNEQDIHKFIASSDNIALHMAAPNTKADGTYPIAIKVTKKLGAGKEDSKVFQVTFNKEANFAGTQGWQSSLASIFRHKGNSDVAARIENSNIEQFVTAHKYDPEFTIKVYYADKEEAGDFKFVNTGNNTFNATNVKTGETLSDTPVNSEQIISALYKKSVEGSK